MSHRGSQEEGGEEQRIDSSVIGLVDFAKLARTEDS